MDVDRITEKAAQAFCERPFDFVTRRDIEIALVHRLRQYLREEGKSSTKVNGWGVSGDPVSYKEDYVSAMDSKLRDHGDIDRVHTQVRFEGWDHHYDVAVFSDSLSGSIQLSSNGSMKFDAGDVEAVIDLKYVINRAYFPTEHSLRDEGVLRADPDELRAGLKTHRNNLESDFKALLELPTDVDTYFLLFSNMNYLFHRPLAPKERDQNIKIRVGEAAQEWIKEAAGDTTVYYAHPRGYSKLTE